MMTRPQPNLQLEPLDKLLEWTAIAIAALTFFLALFYYSKLPEIIPIHFNGSGAADGFGHKSWIWTMPSIALLSLLLMLWVARIPHKFNYTIKVTEANAQVLYRTAARMIRGMNVILMLIFCYLCYTVIGVARAQITGLNKVIMFGLLLGLVVLTIGNYIQMSRIK
ncbi:MAG: DUF1648 domain-containing protein [Bacteroidota bacterium]